MAEQARKSVKGRRIAVAKAGDGNGERAPKRTQRERLLDAMIALAAQVGYQHVSVAQVSAAAGVSRATFYEQFEDKEDCLLAAYSAAAQRLLAQALPVSADGDWSEAAGNTLGHLAHALRLDPDAGRLLFVERLAGGSRARATRRIVIDAFQQRVQEFLDSTPQGRDTLDLPPIAAVGAIRSIVGRYLRIQGEDDLPALADDGMVWVRSYGVPPGVDHWSTGPDSLLPAQPQVESNLAPSSGRRRRRLPRGRHGLPAGVIARSQRTRILFGTAETMMDKGYENVTVADIVAAAGVSREVFYEHFSDKQNAFLEAQQHPTQHILDVCAMAYFSAAEWPQRVWNTYAALLGLIASNPAISHLRLVECYAAGPEAIRRAEEITRSFTIFLEEGYSYRPQARELPRLCAQAIAGAVFEIIQRDVARRDYAGLSRRLPQLTYIAIAPFTGAPDAVRIIEELKLAHSSTDLNAVVV